MPCPLKLDRLVMYARSVTVKTYHYIYIFLCMKIPYRKKFNYLIQKNGMRFIFIHWDGNRDWFSTWNSSSNCDSADNLSYETMSSSNCDSAEDLHMRLWRCITYQVNFSHYLATEWTFSTLFFCYQLYLLSAIGISALMAYVVGNALSFKLYT